MGKQEIVKEGYDRIAKDYESHRDIFKHEKEIKEFMGYLPKNAKVLDVGCGAGVPVVKSLSEAGFGVVGLDFSENMLKLARKNVPKARFVKGDMNNLSFVENSFDGITAFYSIIHVPREKHFSLFKSFHKVLKPNGVILVCMGSDEWEAVEKYHGVDMFWSQFSSEKSLQLVKEAGFDILWDRDITSGGETHYWILARNKK